MVRRNASTRVTLVKSQIGSGEVAGMRTGNAPVESCDTLNAPCQHQVDVLLQQQSFRKALCSANTLS